MSAAPRRAASSISVSASWWGSVGSRSARVSSTLPSTTARRLLKSWATPPASRPTVSSFWDWSSCAARRLRSVTSRTMKTMPVGRPSASRRRSPFTSRSKVPPSARLARYTPGCGEAPSCIERDIDDRASLTLGNEELVERAAQRLVLALETEQPHADGRDRPDAALEVRGGDVVRRGADDGAMQLLAVAQRLLGQLALGDVAVELQTRPTIEVPIRWGCEYRSSTRPVPQLQHIETGPLRDGVEMTCSREGPPGSLSRSRT